MSKKERTPQANIAPFGLRMQPELKAQIEKAARQNERSMNAEIVARLEQSFDEGINERIKELALEAATARGRAEANFEIFKFTAGILAAASNNDRETMQLLADAIRSLNSDDRSLQDDTRSAAIERLSQALISDETDDER